MAGPWFYDRKGEVPAGKKPFFEIPIFNYHQGYLSVNFSDNYYFLSQRHEEVGGGPYWMCCVLMACHMMHTHAAGCRYQGPCW